MAYLNAQQRQELANELARMRFNRAKGHVRRLDDASRLVYYRNSQQTGRLMTRYDLPNLGTRVILVERPDPRDLENGRLRAEYELLEVVVEPLPDNKT